MQEIYKIYNHRIKSLNIMDNYNSVSDPTQLPDRHSSLSIGRGIWVLAVQLLAQPLVLGVVHDVLDLPRTKIIQHSFLCIRYKEMVEHWAQVQPLSGVIQNLIRK